MTSHYRYPSFARLQPALRRLGLLVTPSEPMTTNLVVTQETAAAQTLSSLSLVSFLRPHMCGRNRCSRSSIAASGDTHDGSDKKGWTRADHPSCDGDNGEERGPRQSASGGRCGKRDRVRMEDARADSPTASPQGLRDGGSPLLQTAVEQIAFFSESRQNPRVQATIVAFPGT